MGLLFLFFLSACTPSSIGYTDDLSCRLTFTDDTIAFDTVFTAVGSYTEVFQVYNRNNAHLSISDIRLAKGWNSPFRINLDGQYGVSFSDVDLRARDSMYVFLEVTIDPRDEDAPFEVRDSLVFTLASGVQQHVLFTAWGRDAVVLRGVTLTEETSFSCSRPYFIYDSLVVSSDVTLTIQPGARLFFHDAANLIVYGSLKAMGTVDSLVLFRGDRLDNMFSYLPYDRIHGQWGGITLRAESHDNVFRACDIHSGTYGILAEPSDMSSVKLSMEDTQIHNVDGNGLQETLCMGSAINCLFTNAGDYCVDVLGGKFDFIHCTLANFWPWSLEHKGALNIRNTDENSLFPLLGVNFVNCIITGSGDDEIDGMVAEKSDSTDYSEYAQYSFCRSLINSKDADNIHFSDITWESPDSTIYGKGNFQMPATPYLYDFHLDSLSRARGIADPTFLSLAPFDKDGILREGSIDAGCFQYTK